MLLNFIGDSVDRFGFGNAVSSIRMLVDENRRWAYLRGGPFSKKYCMGAIGRQVSLRISRLLATLLSTLLKGEFLPHQALTGYDGADTQIL